jgi:hypothetical protein
MLNDKIPDLQPVKSFWDPDPHCGGSIVTYFVSTRNSASSPFKIVYREVKIRTSKGYPLTYEWKALPEEYATWEEAFVETEKLNAAVYSENRVVGIYPSTLNS